MTASFPAVESGWGSGPSNAGSRPRLSRQGRILFVAPHPGLTYVEGDVEILSRSFDVQILWRSDFTSRRRLLPRLARNLAKRRCDLVYVWFADPYDTWQILLLARLFGVPGAVVLGGYELADMPDLGYGGLLAGRHQVMRALRLAHTLLPTSALLAREARELVPARRVLVLPPGIDCDFFRPQEGRRAPLVVTVGTVAEPTWRVKGLDRFAACARLLPEADFVILGPCEDARLAERLRGTAGGNLSFSGRLGAPELLAWYRRAAVYAQLSRRESFGVALAEAMACECVPVVSRCGALPDVVGDTGEAVPEGEPEIAAAAIRAALARGSSPEARERVLVSFDAKRRARDLTALVSELVGGERKPRVRGEGA